MIRRGVRALLAVSMVLPLGGATAPVPPPGGDDELVDGARRSLYGEVFTGSVDVVPDAADDELTEQLRHLRELLASRPLVTHAPEALVASTPGSADARALRAVDGGHLLVHAPQGQPFTLDTTVLAADELRGWWFDPRTGTPIDAGTVERGEAVAFFPPTTGPDDAGRDWVLVVDDTTLGLPPPGRA